VAFLKERGFKARALALVVMASDSPTEFEANRSSRGSAGSSRVDDQRHRRLPAGVISARGLPASSR